MRTIRGLGTLLLYGLHSYPYALEVGTECELLGRRLGTIGNNAGKATHKSLQEVFAAVGRWQSERPGWNSNERTPFLHAVYKHLNL
jgi:hypothetical protein